MRAIALWCAVVLMACGNGADGGGPGPNGNRDPLAGVPPPPATQLPDGGMSSTPSDADRLRTQLQWMIANVKSCSARVESVRHEYASALIRLTDVTPSSYMLGFELGGAAATDTYYFDVLLGHGSKLEIGPGSSPGETRYQYSTTVGWSQGLTLTMSTYGATLATYDANGSVSIFCDSRTF